MYRKKIFYNKDSSPSIPSNNHLLSITILYSQIFIYVSKQKRFAINFEIKLETLSFPLENIDRIVFTN